MLRRDKTAAGVSLVRGNHDRIGARLPWNGSVVDVAHVVVRDSDGSNTGVFCSHYAHRVWPRMHRGDLHLYGHSHGTLPGTAASTDVGVDCFDYRPVTPDQIRGRLAENALHDGTAARTATRWPTRCPGAETSPPGSAFTY